MGIRIQPRQLEIPKDDPFKHDLLGRKGSAEVLTSLLGNMEGPCVLAVDAAWGTGKTTFLEMWTAQLRKQDFTVVKLNAWETDFTGDPFLAISSEITNQLEDFENNSVKEKLAKTKSAAIEVAKRAAPALIRIATAGVLDIAPLIEKEIGQVVASLAEDRLVKFKADQGSLLEFQKSLSDLAQQVAAASQGHPLIVVIDELDRCRPSYAIELLEVAKHLFSVDHIVFVLAVNRSQLVHSIGAVYGSGFDSEGYLRRFFDVDFRLPELSRRQFIESTIDSLRFDEYFERTEDPAARGENENVRTLLTTFLDYPDLSLRRIEQALHRLGLLFASLRSDTRSLGIPATVALIIRAIDINLYLRLIKGDITDTHLADGIFEQAGKKHIRKEPVGRLLEAVLILAMIELHGPNGNQYRPDNSPLWQHYDEQRRKQNQPEFPRADYDYSIDRLDHYITNFLSEFMRNPILADRTFGFRVAKERLELFSNDLLEGNTPEQQVITTPEI